MKVTLNINDNFYPTFIDFLKHLPEVSVEVETTSINQWQVDEVANRINTTSKNEYIPLKEVIKTLNYKK